MTVFCSGHINMLNLTPASFFVVVVAVCDKTGEAETRKNKIL